MSTHWNASLYFGTGGLNVTVTPLRSPAAGDSVKFNLLHTTCGERITAPRCCENCEKAVGSDEIVKGYQYAKGKYIRVTDEEIRLATPERSSEIEITKFVSFVSILPDYYDKGYWLTPQEMPLQQKSFGILWRALAREASAGLGSTTLTGKQHACAIVPNEAGLRMYTLVDSKELVPCPPYAVPPLDKTDVDLARSAIIAHHGQIEHSDLRTDQTDRIKELVDSKLAGIEYVPIPALPAVETPPDLMDALRASMAKPKRRKAAVK